MFYSPTTRGFYDPAIHADLPPDAAAVDTATWRALLDAQAAGGSIEPDEDGQPVAVMPPQAEMLRRHRAMAQGAVNDALEGWMRIYTAGVPEAEVASWPTKAEAAAAHLGGAPASAILVEEAALTGETTAELAGKIAMLSTVYTAAVARAAALRRNGRNLIERGSEVALNQGANLQSCSIEVLV